MAGEEFNINSPQQLGDILFEKLGLPAGKKTKRGYSTSADILEKIKDKHPIVPAVLEYRTLSKLKSTYIDGMIPLIDPEDDKIHAHFNQTVTATGRISCTEPNLQNIPVRDALGKEVRKAFIPDEGELFFSADYSQIELRIMAHLSGDANLIEAFSHGDDIHAATAAKIFHKDIADVTADERRKAKTANFGIIYGISAFGLAERMGVSRTEAKELIDGYFATYPGVRQYMTHSIETAREKGYTETLCKRRCYLPDINSHNAVVRGYAERNAINAPIQGSAADIVKKAMIDVDRALSEQALSSRILLQIHDELLVEVAPGEAVSAGAINSAGVLEVEATAAGTDNSLTTIVELVEQAQAEKGDRARIADRIARPLVPGVMVLAVLVGVLGSLLGDPETWITRALVVLVAASPCALVIAVPVTVVSAIGAATKFGVVIKSGAAFERLGGIRHLAVDKTGTLTRNRPEVTAIVAAHGFDAAQVLAWAAAVEQHSTHPLAAAIAAAGRGTPAAQDVAEEAGHGIGGLVDGRRVAVGSPRWIDAGPLKARVEDLEAEGQTCVLVTVDGFLAGAIGVRDELRPEVPEVVRTLRDQGVEVSMLTGDNSRTAAALAKLAGIGDVHAELRPEDKARIVAGFSETSPTAMIGDGINDAPALAGATVGIAMGATGSDAAIESADVAFTGHDLGLIPQALRHARRGGRIINQNIVLSLAIITVLLPLAITGVLGLAAVVLVHEVAEVIVIANGLRAARARKQ